MPRRTAVVDDPHAMEVGEVLSHLDVDSETGLSSQEAGTRREHFGENRLRRQSRRPWWKLVWDQVAEAVIVLLVGAAVAGFLVGETVEAAAIVVVLVVNTIVGFLTEFQAARSMASLREMMHTVADVRTR